MHTHDHKIKPALSPAASRLKPITWLHAGVAYRVAIVLAVLLPMWLMVSWSLGG